jgi:hypothetical protein
LNPPVCIIFIWILTFFIWSDQVLLIPVLNFVDVHLADCIEIIWEGRIHLICSTYYRLSFKTLQVFWFNVQICLSVNAVPSYLRKPFL